MRREALSDAEASMRRVMNGESVRTLPPHLQASFEALVELTDRPALRIVAGSVALDDPLMGEWVGRFFDFANLPSLTSAVGRIDICAQHVGTGFVIAPGMIMTNQPSRDRGFHRADPNFCRTIGMDFPKGTAHHRFLRKSG